jgi:hypothetical protein
VSGRVGVSPAAALLLGLLLGCACKSGASKSESAPAAFDASVVPTAIVAPVPEQPEAPMPPEVFDDGGDEAKALAALLALPAWTGVVERYRLLARRGQAGILVGLLVEHEGTLRLVDESEGLGTLSIPVTLPTHVRLDAPLRVVLWGAWHVEEGKPFVWAATRVETLRGAATPPEFAPGLVARDLSPSEQPVSASAVGRGGGKIWFRVSEQQGRVGDGWLIADGPEGPPVARLFLPGERGSYGDQSRVVDSERWKLTKGHSYWLEIRRFRPPNEGVLPVFRARTPPFRYTKPADDSAP